MTASQGPGGSETEHLGAAVRALVRGQQLFGRFTLQEVLGRGGMGVVWLAYDAKLARKVALKFLDEAVRLDPEALRELKYETRRSLELTHPNIIRVHDFVEDDQIAAISMEYVAGVSLATMRLEQANAVFDFDQIEPWLIQICAALDYAHFRVGMVHRDIKPGNLIIDNRGIVKIADFGVAKRCIPSSGGGFPKTPAPQTEAPRVLPDHFTTSQTSTGGIMSGTPAYMSPQQMLCAEPHPTDDIYSLGATLYELLTGTPPFRGDDLAARIQNEIPAPLWDRLREIGIGSQWVPWRWNEVILSCLDKDPGRRPQSAGEMLERLGLGPDRRLLKHALADEAEEPAAPWNVGLVILLILLPILSGGYLWYDLERENDREKVVQQLNEEKQRMERTLLAVRREEGQLREALESQRQGTDPSAQGSSAVSVDTNPPGATVRVEGEPPQKTPAIFKRVRPGPHRLQVSLEGYENIERIIQVEKGRNLDLGNLPMIRLKGKLQVVSNPSNLPFIVSPLPRTSSGASPRDPVTGTTPALLAVPVGEYEVVIQQEDRADRTSIKVGQDETCTVNRDLRTASVTINSEPSGAQVIKTETLVGRTPIRLSEPAGEIRYQLRAEGYAPFDLREKVEAGQVIEFNPKLTEGAAESSTRKPSSTEGTVILVGGELYAHRYTVQANGGVWFDQVNRPFPREQIAARFDNDLRHITTIVSEIGRTNRQEAVRLLEILKKNPRNKASARLIEDGLAATE